MFCYAKISDIERYLAEGRWKASWHDQYGWAYPWVHEQVLHYARPAQHALDVGAGTCQISAELKRARPDLDVHVVDAPESFERLGGMCRADLVYHCGLLGGDNDLADAAFDLVFSVSVLEHLYEHGGAEELQRGLLDMKRVLRPGGLMIHAMDLILDPEIHRRWRGFTLPPYLEALDMEVLPRGLGDPPTREQMLLDPDLFVVSPQTAHELKWFGHDIDITRYFRLTAVGFILRKRED